MTRPMEDELRRHLAEWADVDVPPLPANATEKEIEEKKKLFYFKYDTTLQGFKLLNERKLNPDPWLLMKFFIDSRVANNEFKWIER